MRFSQISGTVIFDRSHTISFYSYRYVKILNFNELFIFRDFITRPLRSEGSEGVDAAVQNMETYALLRLASQGGYSRVYSWTYFKKNWVLVKWE